MLLILLFFILFALKLAAIALVAYAGPLAAILVILACYALACRLEPSAAPRQPPPVR
jgi:hypothetical protein